MEALMALSMAGTGITEESTKAALAAADKALEGLWEVFANAPSRPAYIEYDLVVDENGEYKWAQNEVDLMIRKAIAAAGKNQR